MSIRVFPAQKVTRRRSATKQVVEDSNARGTSIAHQVRITMSKQFSQVLTRGKVGVERRFSELLSELSVLFASFPRLSDAFDADELPVSFIIKRDSRGAQVRVVKAPPAAPTAVAGHIKKERRQGRRGPSSGRKRPTAVGRGSG